MLHLYMNNWEPQFCQHKQHLFIDIKHGVYYIALNMHTIFSKQIISFNKYAPWKLYYKSTKLKGFEDHSKVGKLTVLIQPLLEYTATLLQLENSRRGLT